jgi:hypothetical protein
MKYLITLLLLIPSALNAMDKAPSAPKPKPVEIKVQPFVAHVRADKNQKTIHSIMTTYNGNSEGQFETQSNSYSYNDTQLTLTEIIPNDTTQQLTVLFSLKLAKDKPAYQGAVIAKYGSDEWIPLGDQESDVRYFLNTPPLSNRQPDQCDCPTQEEHQNDLAWALFPQPAESDDHADDEETMSE